MARLKSVQGCSIALQLRHIAGQVLLGDGQRFCTTTEITYTVTLANPWVRRFEGDVTCVDRPDMANSVAGTIPNEIRG